MYWRDVHEVVNAELQNKMGTEKEHLSFDKWVEFVHCKSVTVV